MPNCATAAGELLAKAASFGPRWLAIVGVTAYRTAFGEARATVGPQARTAGATRLWVLPEPERPQRALADTPELRWKDVRWSCGRRLDAPVRAATPPVDHLS